MNGDSIITYDFPEGYDSGKRLAFPFAYFDKEDVEVYRNEVKLRLDADYIFNEGGSLIILFAAQTARTVIRISRNTPVTETSKPKAIIYAITEAKDIATGLTTVVAEIKNNLKTQEETNTEKYSDLLAKLQASADYLSSRNESIAKNLQNYIQENKEYHNNRETSFLTFKNLTEAAIKELNDTFTENQGDWKPSLETLSRDLNAICRINFDDNNRIKEQLNISTLRIKALEERTCHCHDEPIKEPIDDGRIKTLEKDLKETMSALNFETQVRRVEDAQIKALLKRLLAKFDRLEDFVAGNDPTLGETTLDELRAEMKRQDDTLGRTHLESLVRHGQTQEKLNAMGRTDLENSARLARMKETLQAK